MTSHPESGSEPNPASDVTSQRVVATQGRTQVETELHHQQEHQRQDRHDVSFDNVSDMGEEMDNEKSLRGSSLSHWVPEPGFAYVDGDVAGSGYNETTVDIVAVPCIGASPVDTWARDPLGDGYFEAPHPLELKRYETVKELPGGAVLSPAINRHLPRANQLWIRQGVRKEINRARVILYRHRELTEGYTLEQAADDLLEHVSRIRAGQTKARPIFFVCHSIGGLVAKLALVKASKNEDLRSLVFDCHGMTFFSTPHRGSSYMSKPHLRESIQQLLFLEKPLPMSITEGLRLDYKPLLRIHDQFTDIASELRIWTFCETVDSQLSGLRSSGIDEVHFSAPLVSIKSCLIGTRAEQAFSLESDHANCASFGLANLQIMHSYLADLRRACEKAEYLSEKYTHTPLRLADQVKIELIGFYEDPESGGRQDIRLYIWKHYLREFLDKGPEQCLRERLSTIASRPQRGPLRPSQTSTKPRGVDVPGSMGIWSDMREFGARLFGQGGSSSDSPLNRTDTQSPEIVVTSHPLRPAVTGAASEPPPTATTGLRRSRGLTVPPLSSPGFHRPSSRSSSRAGSDEISRTASDPGGAEISPGTVADNRVFDPIGDRHALPWIDEKDYAAAVKDKHKRLSRAFAMKELAAGFSRPEPSRRKFMWIHLPFNNPHWVKNIFDKLSETNNQNYSKLLSNDLWAKRHVQGRHANLHASYVKPGCAFVPAESNSPRPSSASSRERSRSPGISPTHLYLYLPYLHFDTYKNIIRRRNVIQRRMAHGRARPVPEDIAKLESLECRVIWEYIGYDPPLNARRTLDQYGYPALRDTYARDDDQMLYKLTKERLRIVPTDRQYMYNTRVAEKQLPSIVSPGSPLAMNAETPLSDAASYKYESDEDLEEDILDGNVLMVDQLWLWAVDTTTLTTFFPKRESHPTEGPMFQQADLRNSVYNELNGDLTGRCENALDLAAFVVLHAATVLLDRTSHPDLEIFRIFEEAIGILSERMTSSLKRFRMQTFRGKIHDDTSSDGSEIEDNRSASIKRRHRRELERAERENRENTSALLELRDMDDELNTMRSLFAEQQTTIEIMKTKYETPDLFDLTENGRQFLGEAVDRLEDYKKQTSDMIERVETTRKDYEKLLEMVQRQAQVDEVRWSRLQTELASSQNLSVMIFTTFTVIFLPLSFFTSLFGMNTAEWGGDDDNFVSLRTIGAVSLPASAAIVAGSLVLAFSSRVQAFFKALFRALRTAADGVRRGVTKALVEPLSKAAEETRRRGKDAGGKSARARKRWTMAAKRQQQESHRLRRRERGYDFWEAVLRDRAAEGGYAVPDRNLKGPTKRRLADGRYETPDLNRRELARRRLAGRGAWKRVAKESG